MKIIVDKLPQNPKECIFSEKTYSDSYVCGFHDCVSCNPKTCEYLSEQTYNYILCPNCGEEMEVHRADNTLC